MTSDISFMGALWDSSGDVYNGGFFWDMVLYFLAKCDRKLGYFSKSEVVDLSFE